MDVYILKDGEFDRLQIMHSELQPVPLADGTAWQAPVASAEDTVLAKPDWFRQLERALAAANAAAGL